MLHNLLQNIFRSEFLIKILPLKQKMIFLVFEMSILFYLSARVEKDQILHLRSQPIFILLFTGRNNISLSKGCQKITVTWQLCSCRMCIIT